MSGPMWWWLPGRAADINLSILADASQSTWPSCSRTQFVSDLRETRRSAPETGALPLRLRRLRLWRRAFVGLVRLTGGRSARKVGVSRDRENVRFGPRFLT